MEPGHDRADRDVQDVRRLLVGKLADVDQDDHVAKVVWNCGEHIDDVVL